MAPALAWLTEDQIVALLCWDEERQGLPRHWTAERVRNVLPRMDWFLERRAGDGSEATSSVRSYTRSAIRASPTSS
jgi:hypothetical protein